MLSSRRRLLVPALLIAALLGALPATSPAAERITSGTKVSDAQYQSHLRPLVAIVYTDAFDQYEAQFCAGTLIDELHVLTAGHCLVEDGDLRTRLAPSSFAVLAGTPKLNENSMDHASLVPVAAMFVNPNFNIRTMRWDAAVLRLARPITTVPVMPRLTDADVATLGMGSQTVDALIAGWGDTNPTSDDCCFPSELKGATVPVHPNPTCESNLAPAPALSFDTEFQFCAGRLSSGGRIGTDTCQGDSGGPLIVDVAGVPKHAGVTSFGFGCGQRFFGVYARTTALGAWLDSIPGIPAGDTRDPANGPGDLAVPTVTAQPSGYFGVRLQITPAATGAPATGYTVWARQGAPREAVDVFLGRTSQTTYVAEVPATRRTTPYRLLVRPFGAHGEGPTARVSGRPLVDSVRPTVPHGLRVARRGSFVTLTWRRSVDRQSGVYAYYVQKQVGGRWRAPQLVFGFGTPRLRFNAGRSHGRLRVLAEDFADNRSAYSAAVRY